jgi:adenosylhomocysteinase
VASPDAAATTTRARREATGSNVGEKRIRWATQAMPVMAAVHERFAAERPFEGLRLAASLAITAETAVFARAAIAGGAELTLCSCNPLAVDEAVCRALSKEASVLAQRHSSLEAYYEAIRATCATVPHLAIDDGGDLIVALQGDRRSHRACLAATEETTTGVSRIRALHRAGRLSFPVIAVNDAPTKRLFDNRYGVGQSTIDGILRATNALIAGRRFAVLGYGWAGHGVAARARGAGAQVIVCEVDPVRALEAAMDGYEVMPSLSVAQIATVFVCVTGRPRALSAGHFERMPDGAILCNSGHFDVEVDVGALRAASVSVQEVRPFVEEYRMPDGRRLYLLAKGRLANFGAAEGNPPAIMDLSFATQALTLASLACSERQLPPGMHDVPASIAAEVAQAKLNAMGFAIDQPSHEQEAYLMSWRHGT